jgi:hypothetical protein
VSGGRRRNAHAARRLGWAALVAGLAAATVFLPPLVAPKTHRGTEAAPSPPARSSPAAPSPSAVEARSVAPTFGTVRLPAADPGNVRVGARIIPCASCEGGSRVGYLGGPNTLTMRIRGIAAPGNRKLTVVYETDGPRTLKIRVNDSPVRTLKLSGAHDFVIPAVTTLSIFLPAGTSSIKFFNDNGPAPDINGIVIS